MAVTGMNHRSDAGFFFMRQALVEARLMSDKRACDVVYVATLAEELRNIEKKIAALEDGRSPASDESLGCPDDSPGTEWIHRKARELAVRLRCVEQASRQETDSGATRITKRTTPWRAVPRYPKTKGSAANRETYKGESKI